MKLKFYYLVKKPSEIVKGNKIFSEMPRRIEKYWKIPGKCKIFVKKWSKFLWKKKRFNIQSKLKLFSKELENFLENAKNFKNTQRKRKK